MNAAAYDELVGVIDDAIDLADSALAAAESATAKSAAAPEPVFLVKVAAHRYDRAATALLKTGAFSNYKQKELAKVLENAGPADFLDIMEKLASRAAFTLDVNLTPEGDLVEKSATSPTSLVRRDGESKTDLWVRACEESGISIR